MNTHLGDKLNTFLKQKTTENKKALKSLILSALAFHCRERGIRTPGPVTVSGFQDHRNRPLCHLSFLGANIRTF